MASDLATMGFKYFDCKGVKKITLTLRGRGSGHIIITDVAGAALAKDPSHSFGDIPVSVDSSDWVTITGETTLRDGVHALYFTCMDFEGSVDIAQISF